MTYPVEANIPMTLRHLQGHSLLQAFRCDYARAALCLRGVGCHRVSVCPSVCLCVTNQSCTKTATRRITQTLHDSPWTL